MEHLVCAEYFPKNLAWTISHWGGLRITPVLQTQKPGYQEVTHTQPTSGLWG